jgi:hypothetical protein
MEVMERTMEKYFHEFAKVIQKNNTLKHSFKQIIVFDISTETK